MEMRFWEENSLQHHVKYESNSNDNIPARTPRDSFYCEAANLNFATCEDDCVEYSTYHRKAPPMRVSRQDPLSHRIIEKRRRDRMNNCLADLSRLIPTEYLKKGRGRVEKTEIIEMAIKHMKYLQYMNHYRLGYQECMSETMRFLVEVEGRFPREPICVRLLGHLQAHCDTVCRAANEAAPSATAGSTQVPPTPDGADDKVIPKMEPNNNYESEHHPEDTNTNGFEMTGDEARDAEEIDVDVDVGTEKREEHHSGYKYKNDIKLRFTQDNAKHPQVVHIDRRNSTPISTDNQTCSSLGSPTPHYIDTAPTLTLLKTAQESESMDTWLTPPTASSTRTPDSALYAATNGTPAFASPLLRKSIERSHTLTNGVTSSASHHNNGLTNGNHTDDDDKPRRMVPAFVLHSKGTYYVPITVDHQALLPYLGAHDLLATNSHDVVLHPVAINVNFQPNAHALNLQQPKKFEKI